MTTTPPIGAGTLGLGDDGAFCIRFDRTLKQPVSTVWAALTDRTKFSVWMPGCRVEPRVGGEVLYDFEAEGSATGEVISLRAASQADPTARLEHTWRWEDLPVSTVAWRLEPSEAGTRLTLTHREVTPEPAADFAIGWHAILDTLDRYVEGRSWDDVWDSYGALAAHYGVG